MTAEPTKGTDSLWEYLNRKRLSWIEFFLILVLVQVFRAVVGLV